MFQQFFQSLGLNSSSLCRLNIQGSFQLDPNDCLQLEVDDHIVKLLVVSFELAWRPWLGTTEHDNLFVLVKLFELDEELLLSEVSSGHLQVFCTCSHPQKLKLSFIQFSFPCVVPLFIDSPWHVGQVGLWYENCRCLCVVEDVRHGPLHQDFCCLLEVLKGDDIA